MNRFKKSIRLFLTVALLWSGTVAAYAYSGIVSAKPYEDGFVMASESGIIYWTDIRGNVTDSVKAGYPIAGIDVREGRILAVSPESEVFEVDRGGKVRRFCGKQTSGGSRAVGIACLKETAFILFDNGVILSTKDNCKNFTFLDFNGVYQLYYFYNTFTDICASDYSLFIAGTDENKTPTVFTSASGKIWSPRSLSYKEGRENLVLKQKPLSLAYDERKDSFVMGCEDGYIFHMPGCTHCNSADVKEGGDVRAIAYNNGIPLYIQR